MKAEHEKTLSDLKDKHKLAMDALKYENQQAVSEMRQKYASELENSKKAFEDKMASLDQQLTDVLNRLKNLGSE